MAFGILCLGKAKQYNPAVLLLDNVHGQLVARTMHKTAFIVQFHIEVEIKGILLFMSFANNLLCKRNEWSAFSLASPTRSRRRRDG